MAWDTRKQPPVVVKEGETTTYDMLITPAALEEQRKKCGGPANRCSRFLKQPADRTAQILLEFRKLNHTVEQTELWCTLMRELVFVGRNAVPQICDELDRTNENLMLRRLGFALRAIGDPRVGAESPHSGDTRRRLNAPSSSDFGLIVNNKEFNGVHAAARSGNNMRGLYFALGRPVREIFAACDKLTGQNFDDAGLFGISLSEDSRR